MQPNDGIVFKESDRYVAQDFSWNSRNGDFQLRLCQDILNGDVLHEVNRNLQFNVAGSKAMASVQTAQLSVIIHCKSKKGKPTRNFSVNFHDGSDLRVHWEGVTRLFVRVRIMESISIDGLRSILIDDIGNRHSVSDVEDGDENHSRRPWSDDEDGGTDNRNPGYESTDMDIVEGIYS
jgi:hypothetical protein